MKIGFDAKRALLNDTGLGVYARNLIQSCLFYYPNHDYHLFSTASKTNLESQLVGEFAIHFPEKTIDKLLPSLWRSRRIVTDLQQHKIDVFHGLSNELPFGIARLKKTKKIATIHDVLFISHPAQYPWIDRQIYNTKVKHTCDVADTVIAISESSKLELIKHFKVKENKIEVVYQPCDTIFSESTAPNQLLNFRQKHQLPARFIVQVSSFFPRKNQLNLVKAFHKIHLQIPQNLILVGGFQSERKIVEQYVAHLKIKSRVQFINHLSTSELSMLYQMADLMVYPSVAEGFGIPIIEGLASNLTVLASDISCFREVGGDAIYYCNTLDIAAFSEAIRWALKNPIHSPVMQLQLQKFEPKKLTHQLMNLYEK
jgi:glycosyltransferase involved in cell wall biosynthesis